MLNFFLELRNKNKQYIFLFITNQKYELKNILIKEKYKNIKNYIKVLSLDYKDISKYLNQVNVCICFKKNSLARLGTFSIKFAEALSLVSLKYIIPILEILTKYLKNEIGLTIDIHNDKNFYNIIENINNLENLNKNKIRQCALDNFSIKNAKSDYINIYKNLK